MPAAFPSLVEHTPASLADLMAAVAEHRDREAFAEIFDHFAPRVKAYIRRLGTTPAATDDLLQEVMLAVWHRAGQFDPAKAGVSTWIFTIARNKRIDLARRQKRPELDPNDPVLVPAGDPGADATVERHQHDAMVRAAVAKLPPEQAQLLRLAYVDDKSHGDIAAELGLPLGTVKSRIRLAMDKLRRRLQVLR